MVDVTRRRFMAVAGGVGLAIRAGAAGALAADGTGFQVAIGDSRGWLSRHGGLAAAGRSVDAGTLFQAASCSKTVAALAAMTLVRDGRLDLDRPVNEYLRGWRLQGHCAERATAAALMSHTAGISVSGFPGYGANAAIPTLVQILDGQAPANTQPVRADRAICAEYAYSGGGTCVLQLLIEEISGQRFADYVRAAVLEPLGAAGATFDLAPTGDIAFAHLEDGSMVPGGYHRYPESAAAGLWCRAEHLARIMQGIFAAVNGAPGAIVPRDLAKRMVTPVTGQAALGVFSDGGATIWHEGVNYGFRALMTADLQTGRVTGAVANSDAGMATIAEQLRQSVDPARN
ncbi:MAG: beta-lactamase family protein [Rhizobiaceae bacterium]|nr:beta-lactamase family protein [Rhizobiaceae bacterium]